MTENKKTIISLISLVGFAAVAVLFIFIAAMAAGCTANQKSANEPQFVFGISRTCNDGISEITYSRDVVEVCATDVGTLTVYDVGCDGKNLEVCDDEINYIIAGGKAKTLSRNCTVATKEREKAEKTHLKCLKEISK